MHAPNSGYFSPEGIPYHSVETLMCEAPDYGHETTSEAFSYYIWVEAIHGALTKDWSGLQTAWATMEKYMIPSHAQQPTNDGYVTTKPATYAPEMATPSMYPAGLDGGIPVGADPIATELTTTHGNDVYMMHWIMDVDNWYGFGGSGTNPTYMNTFQRGPMEGVFCTVPQPSWEDFSYGGPNGYLPLFTSDPVNPYSKQWRYTNAPDADTRAIQAIFLAKQWADAQGGSSVVDGLVAKAAKLGDWNRYVLFDKYFKTIGCQSKASAGATGYGACHYLQSWYSAWGGPLTSNGWAFKIGSSHSHFGYQNPLSAYALSSNPNFTSNMGPSGSKDWAGSLTRQIQFYGWLQSAEGAIAGGCTNSYNGDYSAYPAGTSTFFGMAYTEAPVYLDPPSNTWFGFQVWSCDRLIQYYYQTKDPNALPVIKKWVAWASSVVQLTPTVQIPIGISWSGQPDASFSGSGMPPANAGLHVSITSMGVDVGLMACLARCLMVYSMATGDAPSMTLSNTLMGSVLTYGDSIGYSVPETRADYVHFNDPVYVPPTFNGKMPNGDPINSSSTFLSIRSKYKQDPQYAYVAGCLAAGTAPVLTYHRFWGQSEIAITLGMQAIMQGSSAPVVTPPVVIPPIITPPVVTPPIITPTPGSSGGTFTLTVNPTPASVVVNADNSITVNLTGKVVTPPVVTPPVVTPPVVTPPVVTPPVTPTPPPSSGLPTLTYKITSTWQSGGDTFNQYSIDVTNTTSTPLSDITVSYTNAGGLSQAYNCTSSNNTFSFPSYETANKLQPNQVFSFGCIFKGATSFTLVSVKN